MFSFHFCPWFFERHLISSLCCSPPLGHIVFYQYFVSNKYAYLLAGVLGWAGLWSSSNLESGENHLSSYLFPFPMVCLCFSSTCFIYFLFFTYQTHLYHQQKICIHKLYIGMCIFYLWELYHHPVYHNKLFQIIWNPQQSSLTRGQ